MMKKFVSVFIAFLFVQALMAQVELKESLKKIANVYWCIDGNYVDSVDYHKIAEKAIIATLEELDPHSSYLTAKEVAASNETLSGSFDGIGVSYNMIEDTLVVINPIADGPSEKVGVMVGDKIIAVDDTAIAGVNMSSEEIMRRIRGKKGTKVKITVLRESEKIDFSITRDKIPIYSVIASYMATPEIGYVKIERFGATTHEEVVNAISTLKKKGMKKLIIDLQGNGGGYLKSAIAIADEFLSKGKLLLFTEGVNHSPEFYHTSSLGKGLWEDEPIVVLVDQYSASASEILSGALQDWDRAAIVGVRSFGKGLVQQPFNLADGSQIRITIARYHTPSGRCIQKPYEKGKEDYEHEAYDRYKSGELVSADSIHFADSLRYTTLLKKRTVYGGGGIMPDIFVPSDTASLNELGRKLANTMVVQKSCMTYLERNRKKISKYGSVEEFARLFDVAEVSPIIKQNLQDKKIEYTEEQWQKNEKFLDLRIKSLIARDIWGIEGLWKVINMYDNNYKAAINLLENEEKYNRVLAK